VHVDVEIGVDSVDKDKLLPIVEADSSCHHPIPLHLEQEKERERIEVDREIAVVAALRVDRVEVDRVELSVHTDQPGKHQPQMNQSRDRFVAGCGFLDCFDC